MDVSWLSGDYSAYDCGGLFDALYCGARDVDVDLLRETQRHEVTSRVLELERDCELRTLYEIQAHRLPIDQIRFAQDAFRYLASYAVAYHRGKWCKFNYRNLAKLPTDLTVDYFDYTANPKIQRMWRAP